MQEWTPLWCWLNIVFSSSATPTLRLSIRECSYMVAFGVHVVEACTCFSSCSAQVLQVKCGLDLTRSVRVPNDNQAARIKRVSRQHFWDPRNSADKHQSQSVAIVQRREREGRGLSQQDDGV
uniref:Putative secreted protein n=1 Tax=Anopheles darlingi TaxID=43151 RepID=A0A2M4D3I6_ANODA